MGQGRKTFVFERDMDMAHNFFPFQDSSYKWVALLLMVSFAEHTSTENGGG